MKSEMIDMFKKSFVPALALVTAFGIAACDTGDEYEVHETTEVPATTPAQDDPTWDDPMMNDTVIMDDTLRAEDDWDEDGTGTDY